MLSLSICQSPTWAERTCEIIVCVREARNYRGRSAEERVDERRDRLIGAGRSLVRESGLSGLNIVTVCARANLTRRYFYESFANVDEFLDALFESIAEESARKALAAAMSSSGSSLSDRLGTAFLVVFEFVSSDWQLGSWGAGSSRELDRCRDALRDTAIRHGCDLVLAISGRSAENLSPRDAALLQGRVAYASAGAVELWIRWATGVLRLERSEVVEIAAESLQSMLEPIFANGSDDVK